jgi:hypothetical protein
METISFPIGAATPDPAIQVVLVVIDAVEVAALEWVDGYNNCRIMESEAKPVSVPLRQSTSARLKSSCSKALAMRLISTERAPTDLAVARQVAVAAATSLMVARACGRLSPKNPDAASSKSIEQVPSSRSMFVVSTRALRSVGTGLRS